MPSIAQQRGVSLAKIVLLIFFLGLAVGYWVWRDSYGHTGFVHPLNFDTRDRVAFLRQEANGRINLFVVKLDGTDEQRLTDDPDPKRGLAWSPNGKQLCYSAEAKRENSSAYQLFLFGASGPKQITVNTGSKHSPEWRADGKQIAFLVGGFLKVIEPNGDGLDQLYPPVHRETGEDHEETEQTQRKRPPLAFFRWAPNGKSIATVHVAEGEQDPIPGRSNWFRDKGARQTAAAPVPQPEMLLIYPIGAHDVTARPETNASKVGFSWFPDSQRIAVSMLTGEGLSLMPILRADEPQMASPTVLEAAKYTVSAENPSVSPDGSQIAFEAWRTDSAENRELLGIAVISTDPEKKIVIRSKADLGRLPIAIKGRATNPKWTRDGAKLVYQVTDSSGKRDIWVAGVDGSNPLNLTRGNGDNFDASCSPAK